MKLSQGYLEQCQESVMGIFRKEASSNMLSNNTPLIDSKPDLIYSLTNSLFFL